MNKIVLAILLIVALCACERSTGERIVFSTPSPLPTQTERVVIWTSTPVPTYTKIVQVVTSTPQPEYLCVMADEAVYLRPSADLTGYPISPLPNGTRLIDLGGKDGDFVYVSNGEDQGWVHRKYVKNCK